MKNVTNCNKTKIHHNNISKKCVKIQRYRNVLRTLVRKKVAPSKFLQLRFILSFDLPQVGITGDPAGSHQTMAMKKAENCQIIEQQIVIVRLSTVQ